MVCPRCGLANPQDAASCARCGLAFAPVGPDSPAAPADPRRAGYSSPLGRSAEPTEAIWREESATGHVDEGAPSAQPVAPPPSPAPDHAPASRPIAITQSPGALDDDPPPWLADALRAQGQPTRDGAPDAPSTSAALRGAPPAVAPQAAWASPQPLNPPQQPPAAGYTGSPTEDVWHGPTGSPGANGAGGLGAARLVPPAPPHPAQPVQRPFPANGATGQPASPPAGYGPAGARPELTPPASGGRFGQIPTPPSRTPGRPPSGALPSPAPDALFRSGSLGSAGRMPDPRLSGMAPSDPARGEPLSYPSLQPNSRPDSRPNSRPGSFPSALPGSAPGRQSPLANGAGWAGGAQSPLGGLSGPGASTPGIGQPMGQPWLANGRPAPLGPASAIRAQPPLPIGAVLKGGRYRLLQRFLTDPHVRTRASEPPLMIASDAEAPGVRVLAQELTLPASVNGVRNDAEIMRQTITERLYAFAPDAHFPTLVDSFGEHGRHFLIFESPSGDLLNDRLARARGPLPEREVVEYALRTLDALSALENGRPPLTHGALCPAHIILRPSGSVTLVGFSPTLLVAPLVTNGGVISVNAPSGIAGYAAPEQERGQASGRSDLYSLGAIMSYAATGVAPTQQLGALQQPVRRLNPNLSLEFEEVVGRAMRAAAPQRFQTADEMRQALQALEPRGRNSLPDLSPSVSPALREATSAHTSLTARRARRRPRNLAFVFGLVVALIALIAGVAAVALTHHGTPGGAPSSNAMASTPNPSAALYQQKGIGVSGGEFVFDFGANDAYDKQQAVRALAAGGQQQAYTDYLQAIAASPADAEARIYGENLGIDIHHYPYVTVVVGVAFDGETALAGATGQDILARDELQGVYQAQENVNSSHLLPGGEQMQVLIANSGVNPSDAGAVAQAIVAQLRAGNPRHIIGLISWPGAGQAQAAAAVLNPTGLPILGTTIGVDSLSSANLNNYFAIVPTLAQQGAELATAAAQQLDATHILVAQNAQDPGSMAMAQGFEQQIAYLQQHGIAFASVTSVQNYTSGSASSYAAIAQQAVAQSATLVFLCGADQDAFALAQATRHLGAGYHILVGPQADTPAIFGMGTDPLAQTVRQNAAALTSLYVTTFANASEAIALNAANSAQAGFEADYQGVFGHTAVPSGLPDPDPLTMLAYDAATTLLSAAAPNDQGTVVYPTILQMRTSLLANNRQQGYPGVSGEISFGPDGGQPEKAMAILSLTPVASATGGQPAVTISLVAVVGGTKVYCGSSGCNS